LKLNGPNESPTVGAAGFFYTREKSMDKETDFQTAIDENGVAYFVPPTKAAELTATDGEEVSVQSDAVQSDEEIAMAAQAAMNWGTWRFQISLRDERNFLLTK
jgi:hypothetical protein